MVNIIVLLLHGIVCTVGGYLVLGTGHLDSGLHKRRNKFVGWVGLVAGLFLIGWAVVLIVG